MIKIVVSVNGDDVNKGSVTDPVKTIPKALHIVRDLRKETVNGDTTARIELEDGCYRVTTPIRLGPEDSGLQITAAEGCNPVIDGGRVITGWRKTMLNGKPAFAADAGELLTETGRPLHSLFINGSRRPRSRWPKEGYFYLKPGDEEPQDDPFRGTVSPVLADSSSVPAGWDLSASELRVLHKWVDERMPVTSFNHGTGTFTCACRSVQRMTGEAEGWKAERAFLENVREAADAGDWYLDETEQTLYVLPLPGENIESLEVAAPLCLQFVRIRGRLGEAEERDGVRDGGLEPVTGVRIAGITFRHADWLQPVGDWGYRYDPYEAMEGWHKRDSFEHFVKNNKFDPAELYAAVPQAAHNTPGSIALFGAHDCVIEDCGVEHIGYYGFELGDGCRGNVIQRNRIIDAGGGGINADGGNDPCDPVRHLKRNVFRDNEIREAGRVFFASCGILVCFGAENKITGNHIHDLRYTGISCGWVWGREHQTSRENLIAFNHIHGIKGPDLLSDLGGIYILGIQPGTVLRGNVIHDIHFDAYGGSGIYTDAATANVVVEDNLIYDIEGAGITVNHNNCENSYRRNVIAFTGDAAFAVMRNPTKWSKHYKDYGRAGTFLNNIILSDGTTLYRFAVHHDEYPIEELAAMICSDANMVWVYGGVPGTQPEKAALGWEDKPLIDWADWLETGQDRSSVYGEPGFTDPERRDFSLPDGSPGALILQTALGHPCRKDA